MLKQLCLLKTGCCYTSSFEIPSPIIERAYSAFGQARLINCTKSRDAYKGSTTNSPRSVTGAPLPTQKLPCTPAVGVPHGGNRPNCGPEATDSPCLLRLAAPKGCFPRTLLHF